MSHLHACLYVPDYPAAVRLRGERNLCAPPTVVFIGKAPNGVVYAVNEAARAGGIRESMPLAEAKARWETFSFASPASLNGNRSASRSGTAAPSKGNRSATSARPASAANGNPSQGKPLQGSLRSNRPAGGVGHPRNLRPGVPHASSSEPARTTEASPEPTTLQRTTLQHATLQHATLQHATLQVLPRDPEAEKQTQQELLDLVLTISPQVEDAAPGMIVLDLAGLPDPYHSASRLSLGAEKLGLAVNLGVSRNRFVALCAARTQAGVTHVYPGQEAGFLSPQPVDVLPLEKSEQATLARWGIRTIGELARLPEDSLVARFGTRGAQLLKLARGEGDAVLHPYEPPLSLEETTDLDWQVCELEPLAFLLSDLLNRLCFKLQGLNLAAAEIRVSLKLAEGSRFERAVSLSYPLADPRVLLTLVRLDLAAHPPGDAIEGVSVSAKPVPRRMMQFALFEPSVPTPEKLAVTLARLANLVGSDRVGAPKVVDTHRPGAFAVEVFEPVRLPGRGRKGAVASGGRSLPGRAKQPRLVPAGAGQGVSPPLKTAKNGEDLPREESRGGKPGGLRHIAPAALLGIVPATDSRSLGNGLPTTTVETKFRANRMSAPPGTACRAPTSPKATEQQGGHATSVHRKSVGEARVPGPASDALAFEVHDFRAKRARQNQTAATLTLPDPLADAPRRFLAFRCFRPPAEAEVILRDGLPVYVRAADLQGPVHTRAGPWHVCGEWWTPEGWSYEEWDVEVNQRLYRVCCEKPTRVWYVTGAYD